MREPDRPGLLEVIAAFFAAERAADVSPIELGPAGQAAPEPEPELEAEL
jgi:hypothetical protein